MQPFPPQMWGLAIGPVLMALLMFALWVFLLVFVLVVIWRFMRAHERIADATEQVSRYILRYGIDREK